MSAVKDGTNDTPVGSGIDIVNNGGVISLDNKRKQKTEIVNCGCYKMNKEDKNQIQAVNRDHIKISPKKP